MSWRRLQHGTRRSSPWGRVQEEDLAPPPRRRWPLVLAVLAAAAALFLVPGLACAGRERPPEAGSGPAAP